MNYMIYAKDPAIDKRYGPMDLQKGTYNVGLVYATLVQDIDRAKGYADKLAADLPHMAFQVRQAGRGRPVYEAEGATLREERAKRLVESLLEIQEGDGGAAQFPCPRCGHSRMDPVPVRNALSRRANVYICSECGMDEAMRDMAGKPPLPLPEWGMVKGLDSGRPRHGK